MPIRMKIVLNSRILYGLRAMLHPSLGLASEKFRSYTAVDVCIFRDAEKSGAAGTRRNLPHAACFLRYTLESSANDTAHVCGLKRVRSELSRYKAGSGEKRFTRAARAIEFLLEPFDLTKLIAAVSK